MLSWALWKNRNTVVREGKNVMTCHLVFHHLAYIRKWEDVRFKGLEGCSVRIWSELNEKWKCPDEGCTKVNVDAVISNIAGGIGAVFWDCNGRFTRGFALPVTDQECPQVLEALGIKEVLT